MKKILLIVSAICILIITVYSQVFQKTKNTTLMQKKELIKQELIKQGYSYNSVIIISEKRSKFYNSILSNSAKHSPHLKGHAVDYWVMDLNNDGTWDNKDIYLMQKIILKVEKNNPSIVGGTGLYLNRGFLSSRMVHTDIRGYSYQYYY